MSVGTKPEQCDIEKRAPRVKCRGAVGFLQRPLVALRRVIRDEGMSAILVEQNAKKILGVTDNAIIIERGCVVHSADSATLIADRAALEKHLGVTDTGPRRIGRARQ